MQVHFGKMGANVKDYNGTKMKIS